MQTGFTEDGTAFYYDVVDEPIVSSRKWTLSGGYVRATVPIDGERCLHRIIMRPSPEQEVDHKDRNRLNCQRENLRFATRQQNAANREFPKNRKHRGVVFHNGKWQASIRVNYRLKYLGRFNTEKEAADAYDAAAREAFGEFAWQNGAQ